MSNQQVDRGRHDRVVINLGPGQYERLEHHAQPDQTVDDLVETLLADETTWSAIAARIHGKEPVRIRADLDGARRVRCDRSSGWCERSIVWRNTRRCGCPNDRAT